MRNSLTKEEISSTIRNVASTRDAIAILIAHADRIYLLERGRICDSGTHDELLERTGLYDAMWRRQEGEGPAVRAMLPDAVVRN